MAATKPTEKQRLGYMTAAIAVAIYKSINFICLGQHVTAPGTAVTAENAILHCAMTTVLRQKSSR
ncbi:hypothetical protein DXT99_13505 [Pontibacter diazotrophicus]|uniref:Uncharacterized protein n=1 Tax=Pontibacter diazotrophicus TaxID=1400979 RepID=A0A3D8LBJ6_9BACT|nr:hypothetical protein DXT99_13505 [Pontibacter diazotrophicus]